jgi:S1-C subfamily serine protease
MKQLTAVALTVLTALSTLASPASAQDRDYSFSFSGRPRIGVMVASQADAENDKLGATVQRVTPDGPADKAGIKAGDIITKFNGTPLGGVKADDPDESGPGQKLIELAQKLDVGDTVTVEYRRGTDTKSVKIVAADLGMTMWGHGDMLPRMSMRMPGMPGWGHGFDGPDGEFHMFMGGDALGLDLVDLNPDLGEYFGTKAGVLVVSTPSDSTIPLKAGDVILKIDGREPKNVSQAERILRSYDSGETAKLEVMRKQKRLTLNWTVPKQEWRWKTPRPERVKIERT